MERSLSRRDFLKLLLTGGGGLAAAALVPDITRKILVEDIDYGVKEIRTADGSFYIFFENHTARPEYSLELDKRGLVPDVHFVEMSLNQEVVDFQNSDATDVLYWASYGKGGESFGPFLDAQTIYSFSQNKVLVAYEGMKGIDDEGFVNGLVDFSKGIVDGVSILADKTLNNLGLQDEVESISQFIAEIKTEDYANSFRSLMVALKLKTLAKYYKNVLDRESKISVSMGKVHESHLLEYLEDSNFDFRQKLNKIPDALLWKYIALNGGVDTFCSTLVIDVNKAVSENESKTILVVNAELRNYLRERYKVLGEDVV